MAESISNEISREVKNLITNVCKLEEGTERFERLEKGIINKIKKSDTMYFLNRKEVDQSIEGMAEKYNNHTFVTQASALLDAYHAYVPNGLQESDLIQRLNIVKFLLCMSETPTRKFLENPEAFLVKQDEVEEDIDWAEYLNEGIEVPNYESEEYSDLSSEWEEADDGIRTSISSCSQVPPFQIKSIERETILDFARSREELLNTIQHTWYNQNTFHEKPPSTAREANIGILWEDFAKKVSMGIMKSTESTIISEYKVIREILWQLWHQDSSAAFEIIANNFVPRSNVTISSVRLPCFKPFITSEFMPHIEVMQFFRNFSDSLKADDLFEVPQTYRMYDQSLQNILKLTYRKFVDIEEQVRDQETTYTLLKLVKDLEEALKPVYLLKKIHKEVLLDFTTNNNLVCAATLLVRLHGSLFSCISKLDHDLKIVLFLESLKYYFKIIDNWLTKSDLSDVSYEFPIIRDESAENCLLLFNISEDLTEACKDNGIMKIILGPILQMGRNLHFLRLLGKFFPSNEFKETIYEEFVRMFLEKLCEYFKVDPTDYISSENATGNADEEVEVQYKCPVINSENCKHPTDMDKLENLVDARDGFLMLAFEEYFIEKNAVEKKPDQSLFVKVSSITKTSFPLYNHFENILNVILKERFTISGLMVKEILIEEYLLKKQLRFYNHLFMFMDDLIFMFYKKIFEWTASQNKTWGKSIRLTHLLQDIIIDVYPEFYDKIAVCVKDDWKLCYDSLAACSMISFQYKIQWPLNLIITEEQTVYYTEIFHFILKVKWALYTLHNLAFVDLGPRMQKKKNCITNRLKYLKFVLTNLVYSIQHYIFSFTFPKCWQKFDLDFEKANDILSIIESHSEFIRDARDMIMNILKCGKTSTAFKDVIDCVNTLKYLWMTKEEVNTKALRDCQRTYQECYDALMPVIS